MLPNHDADALRMIDANLNRAREALRVIEDFARFALDDRAAAAAAKHIRHELRGVADSCGRDELLAARDTPGDVGRGLKAPPELRRTDLDDVVRAAFARFGEALRVIGECIKIDDAAQPRRASPPRDHAAAPSPDAGSAAAITPFDEHAATPLAVERARYRGYELEQALVLRGGLRARFRACRLYVIITADLCRRDWLDTAAAAVRGGATCLQLREKTLPDAELLVRARRLRELTAATDTLLVVNDRADIARLSGADGVHVGQDDLSVRDARRVGGGRLLIGKSTHTREQFEAALLEEPDYIAIGPMFPSATKPQSHIAGIEMLAWARPRTQLPLAAIGGITPENAAAIRELGACLCACSSIVAAADPESAARAFCSSVP